jgi:hypothetical protein
MIARRDVTALRNAIYEQMRMIARRDVPRVTQIYEQMRMIARRDDGTLRVTQIYEQMRMIARRDDAPSCNANL